MAPLDNIGQVDELIIMEKKLRLGEIEQIETTYVDNPTMLWMIKELNLHRKKRDNENRRKRDTE